MLRLDLFLVQNGYVTSREKAKRAIQEGNVLINGQVAQKAALTVDERDQVEVKLPGNDYVSRGGHKLQKALDAFSFSVKDKVVADLGASTGGFTDCLLKNGAKKVYAIDVGTNQLVDSLRKHPDVVVMEKTNARQLDAGSFLEPVQLITADLSFISLRLVFPVFCSILMENGSAICLVKPQFEAGKESVGKGGIVKDAKTHKRVLNELLLDARNNGLVPLGLTFSPITGGDGNIEFLLGLKKSNDEFEEWDIESLVDTAHKALKKGGKQHEKGCVVP